MKKARASCEQQLVVTDLARILTQKDRFSQILEEKNNMKKTQKKVKKVKNKLNYFDN